MQTRMSIEQEDIDETNKNVEINHGLLKARTEQSCSATRSSAKKWALKMENNTIGQAIEV